MHIDEASSVGRLAFEMIQDHHPHLQQQTILYCFTDQEPSPRAKACKRWGRVKVAGAEANFLYRFGTEDYQKIAAAEGNPPLRYLVFMWRATWQGMRSEQQRFAIDELLTHCQVVENEVSGELSYIVEGHEFEGYTAVIQRHGAVMEMFRPLVRMAQQIELPIEETAEQGELDLAERDEDLVPFLPVSDNGQVAEESPVVAAVGRIRGQGRRRAAEPEADQGPALSDEQLAALAEAAYQREARESSDRLAAESAVPA